MLVFRQGMQGFAEAFCEDKCGLVEEVTKFLRGVARETLSDIGRNGDDGATKLIRERKAFFGRQNLTELIDFDNQVHAELPYVQISEA